MGLVANVLKLFKGEKKVKTLSSFENSPALIEQLRHLLSAIADQNANIVGGIYSTSGHDNTSLVYRSTRFANNCLDSIIGKHPDSELISAMIDKIDSPGHARGSIRLQA